jgi:hypothetical protein
VTEFAWTDVRFTLNGQPFDPGDVTKITYRKVRQPALPMPRFASKTTSGCVTIRLRRGAWRQLVGRLRRAARFRASFETLMRRASYGGRKGRRAMRRLLAMSDATWRHELRGVT